MNPYEQCPSDADTVKSLALEIEEPKGELSRVHEFLNEQFDVGFVRARRLEEGFGHEASISPSRDQR